MLMIVGLGNPGPKYARNRHNIGFMAVDAVHRHHRFGPWRQRFHADVSEGTLGDQKCLLMKPLTFMNRSGQSVGEAATFFKLAPADVLVIHDEVDLPPGKIRMKTGGGAGGHNGLRSITGAIGDGYRRLRIGVGHPGARELVSGYVLHDFAKAEAEWIDPLLDATAEFVPLLAEGKDSTFGNRMHEKLGPDDNAGKKQKPVSGLEKKADSKSEAAPAPAESKTGPFAGLKRLFGLRD